MSLSELIKNIKENGLMSVAPIRFIGKAKPTLEFIALINDTEIVELSPNYWTCYFGVVTN